MSNKDLTYRPPRSAKSKVAGTSPQGDSGLPDEIEIQVDCTVKDSAAHGTQSSVQSAGDIVLRDARTGNDCEFISHNPVSATAFPLLPGVTETGVKKDLVLLLDRPRVGQTI